jgi:sugar phosphate isomerase/epimerase
VLDRLSFNQATAKRATLRECVDACVKHGIRWIAPWRERVAEVGVAESARMIRDAGLRVSSLCRGGFFSTTAINENLRAIDEAAELGAECLVLVCGADREIGQARRKIADGIAEIAPYAASRGVRLGIEPLHPMFAADRSAITRLDEAIELAERFDLGVIVDVFHVWWDWKLYEDLKRARVFGFHVSDWAVPLPGIVTGRSMMGDGVIEIRRIREAVDACGYNGPIEVEIFNEALWARPTDEIFSEVVERYLAFV